MQRTQFKGIALLALTAFIWGTSFVAQSIGMRSIGPFTYSAVRSLLAVAVLLPFSLFALARAKRDPVNAGKATAAVKKSWKCGVFTGLAVFAGTNLQQFAFLYTTAGKIAFITALYMVLVPLFGVLLGRRVRFMLWVSVAIALAGLWLLSVTDGFGRLNLGDLLTLAAAAAYAVHILLIDRFAADAEPVTLSAVQFLVAFALSSVGMLLFESPDLSAIRAAAWPLLYSGVLSSGLAYTLQIFGQKYTDPTVASLIMCGESIFGVISAAVILKEIPTVRETAGILLMLFAVVLAQFGVKKKPSQSPSET